MTSTTSLTDSVLTLEGKELRYGNILKITDLSRLAGFWNGGTLPSMEVGEALFPTGETGWNSEHIWVMPSSGRYFVAGISENINAGMSWCTTKREYVSGGSSTGTGRYDSSRQYFWIVIRTS